MLDFIRTVMGQAPDWVLPAFFVLSLALVITAIRARDNRKTDPFFERLLAILTHGKSWEPLVVLLALVVLFFVGAVRGIVGYIDLSEKRATALEQCVDRKIDCSNRDEFPWPEILPGSEPANEAEPSESADMADNSQEEQ